MRTTLRIDDDLVRTLKDLAHKEDVTFGQMLNRVLRAGLTHAKSNNKRRRFRQETCELGEPAMSLDKALALAAAIEDSETAGKLSLRK